MQLAVDIGNTNTVVGVYKGETLKDHFRVSSNRNMTSDEAGFFITGLLERMKIPNEEIDKIVVASVVPTLTPVCERTSKKFFGCIPIFVTSLIPNSRLKLPLTSPTNSAQTASPTVSPGYQIWRSDCDRRFWHNHKF